MIIQPDVSLSGSCCIELGTSTGSTSIAPNLHARATRVFNQLITRCNLPKLFDYLLHFAEISPDEHAFTLSTAATLSTYNTRIYICCPYSGDPADFECFVSGLEIRLSRKHLSNACASVERLLSGTSPPP